MNLSGRPVRQEDENMSLSARVVAAIIETLFAMLVGAIAMPIIWFISRILGLIHLMAVGFGGLKWLMFLGGAVFGALAGAIAMIVVMASLEEKDKLGVALGAFGGAIGGLCSSVMFFPIVVVL
jgi:hypothetical protein